MQLLDDSDINELDVLEESITEDNQERVKGMHFTIYPDGKKVEAKFPEGTSLKIYGITSLISQT
jgi:hypothetical protein